MHKRKADSDTRAQASARQQRRNRTPGPVAPARPESMSRVGDDCTQQAPPSDTQSQLFSERQLQQLTEAIAAGFADRGSSSPASIPVRTTDSGPTLDETPPGNEVCDFASFFSGGDDASNLSAQVPSYSSELGYNVPNNIKVQISNGQYVNLAKLAHNFSDPDDETQYFSVRDGGLTMSKKSRVKPITDIHIWTDLFLVYASIYVTAHPECATALFKYMHTIRLGASRSSSLGWRDYDVQFRLKKERNPGISFANVDQELWLLYMQGPLAPGYINKDQQGKCYDYNFRGVCQKKSCPYKHLCMRCSRNHPSIRCFSLNLPANRSNSRPITAPTAGRPIPSPAVNTAKPASQFRHQ